MSKPIKLKSTVKKFQKNPPSSSLNMTIYEKDMIMSNLLNVLFNQVKLQQEVRDRWFGHYLTIIGSLTALATLCLKLFENTVKKKILYMFLGLMFLFASSLGILFFILYLCQRKNYKQTYNYLSVVQNEMFKSMSYIPKKLYEKSTFTTRRRGADFYTLLIQSLIDAVMFSIGILFLLISQSIKMHIVSIFAIIGFILIIVILQLIRYFFERKGTKKNETK